MIEEGKVIIRTQEGGFAIAGLARDLSLRDLSGGVLLIVDSNGAVTGRTYFFSPRTNPITALVQTSDGGFVLAAGGGPAGTTGFQRFEARLIRCNPAGQISWSRNYSDFSTVSLNALKIAPDGTLYMALHVARDAATSPMPRYCGRMRKGMSFASMNTKRRETMQRSIFP